jgi:hypothetical protein
VVDQRSNAYGPGAAWPHGHGADVAYSIDEHPSNPPAPWRSGGGPPPGGADPGAGRHSRTGWDASDPGRAWSQGPPAPPWQARDADPGWPAATPEPAWGAGPPGTGDPTAAWAPTGGGRDWAAGTSPPARTTGHDLGPITGPEWPAVPADLRHDTGSGTGWAPAGDDRTGDGGYGSPRDGGYAPVGDGGYGSPRDGGYPPARDSGYAPTRDDGYSPAREDFHGPAAGGPGPAWQQVGTSERTDPVGQHARYEAGYPAAYEDTAGWEQRPDTGWADARTAVVGRGARAGAGPTAWPGEGRGELDWDEDASFDAAFPGDERWHGDGERPRRRGLVLLLAVALVVLLGAVAGATWALTMRDTAGDGQAGVRPPAGQQGGVPGGTPGEVGGAQEGAANQVETEDFSFAAPKDWRDITERARSSLSGGSRVVTALARTRQDGTGSSIVVMAGPNESGAEPSIAALGAALKARTESEGATSVGDPKPMNLDDGDAVAVDYEGELRGSPIAGRRVLSIRGDKTFVIFIEGKKEHFEEDLPAFDEVLASWNWAS